MAYYGSYQQNPPYTGQQTAQPNYLNQNGYQNFNYGTNNSALTVANVKGEDGARNYPVAAGNTVLLLDMETGKFWLKSTAPNGSAEPLRSFSFTETTPKNVMPNVNGDFVTKKELDDLRSYLDNQFHDIKNQLYKTKRGPVNDKSDAK